MWKTLKNRHKQDEFDVEEIERKAKILSNNLTDVVKQYDERTEEVLELLREKSQGLWDCRHYYNTAMELKDEARVLKSERNERIKEIESLKRCWRNMARQLIESNLVPKVSSLKTDDDFIAYLQMIQFLEKESIPQKSIIKTMERLAITKEEIERDQPNLYTNLNMKDW